MQSFERLQSVSAKKLIASTGIIGHLSFHWSYII